MKNILKLIHLGVGEKHEKDFHSFQTKTTNIVALIIPLAIYLPRLVSILFQGGKYPSEFSFFNGAELLICSTLILYLNHKRKYLVARYILVAGMSVSLFTANLTNPTFKDVFSPYILIALACGGLFELKRDKLISLSICVICLGVAVAHSIGIFSLTSSHVPVPPPTALTFYRHLAVVLLCFYFLSLTSSSIKKNEKQLKAQLRKIQNLESQQKNYFSNTAHELKTPLTLISGHTDFLLKNYGGEPAIQNSLKSIKKNTRYLMRFTDQILNLIKTDNTKVPVNVVRFNLPELIRETLNNFDIAAANRKIDFQKPVFVPNIKIISDAQKLLVILNNLLSNAFKYTQSNGVISVNVLELENAVQVIVQDSGSGIKEEDLEHIFDLYFQTSSLNASILGGTGIGLTVCKEYIELLGGTIGVQSKWGEGSTFSITFLKQMPLESSSIIQPYYFNEDQDNQLFAEDAVPTKSTADPKLILVVEDNLELCNFFKTILGQQFKLAFSYHGEEALAYLEKQQPDLIITDIMMPVMDGMELLTRLKGSEQFNNIPILMLTAKTDSFTQAKALRIGVDDYLLKPFDSDVLMAHIENLLELAENRIYNRYQGIKLLESDKKSRNHLQYKDPPKLSKAPATKAVNNVLSRDDQMWLTQFEEVVAGLISDINLDLDRIADEMAISKTHLNRRVNSVLGISPKRYIREIRLNKGKKMLEDRSYNSVKAVAYSVGFKSEKVFSRNFKTRFGKYPSEYL